MRLSAINEPPDPRTGDWEPEPDPTACTCGLRADEDRDVLGEHHMRRCPRFAFAPAPEAKRWLCSCGHTTETTDDGGGRVYSVQCGCGREMRRAS